MLRKVLSYMGFAPSWERTGLVARTVFKSVFKRPPLISQAKNSEISSVSPIESMILAELLHITSAKGRQ